MSLETGTRLGPYEILGLRGKGGMGEVYRARDTRLGRTVAVKVLPSKLSQDPTFLKRFEREARTISQLQHSNICTLYDAGSENGVEFLVMEYLEGETLEDRIARGSVSIDEVVRIGGEVAGAIDAAHRQGVVHRDLKPSNVMLTEMGTKVLDFGMAREVAGIGDAVDTKAATVSAITKEGGVVGTMPYMAPEQLEAKPADSRTDIWALGCVLYEMTTGGEAVSRRHPGEPGGRHHGLPSRASQPQTAGCAGPTRSDRAPMPGEGPGASVADRAGLGARTRVD